MLYKQLLDYESRLREVSFFLPDIHPNDILDSYLPIPTPRIDRRRTRQSHTT